MACFAGRAGLVKLRKLEEFVATRACSEGELSLGGVSDIAIAIEVNLDEAIAGRELKRVLKEAITLNIFKTHRIDTGRDFSGHGYLRMSFRFCVNGGTSECEIMASLISASFFKLPAAFFK